MGRMKVETLLIFFLELTVFLDKHFPAQNGHLFLQNEQRITYYLTGGAGDAYRRALGVGAVRRAGPPEVAVRRLVQRRHHRQQTRVGRDSRVSESE